MTHDSDTKSNASPPTVLRKERRDTFEQTLKNCTPSAAPKALGDAIAQALQEDTKVSNFPQPTKASATQNPQPRSWSMVLGAAAAVALVAVVLLQQKQPSTTTTTTAGQPQPVAIAQPSTTGSPRIEHRSTEPSTLEPIGFEREVIDVENLGYVHLEGGQPYHGYRFRTKDTQHWSAKPGIASEQSGPQSKSLHLSSERDNILYLPVTFH